ncbi:helix-turn-helix transcriptional regulator [Paenibacillus sp. FSL R7-0204]|uniref:helix-turn-helix domain-containing protein n=1 Tax=Paenibacillus sp. FSL R7-0204 TaxID=2921675 RepID=UPI0030F7656A
MKTTGIHKQFQELRKNKGKTQEELAEVFGVTNQAVSKWESGACYPDTALLPEIANYFGVSLDFLFGRVPDINDQSVVKDIKLLFEQTPAKERFTLACQIAFYLHEGIVSNGYKGYLPWDPIRRMISRLGEPLFAANRKELLLPDKGCSSFPITPINGNSLQINC